MFHRHPFLSFATFVYLGVVAWLTLGPQPFDESNDGWLWRLLGFFGRHELTEWITYQRVEFTANVFMFIPVGTFFLLLFGRKLWFVAIAAGVTLTVVIETVQRYLPNRVSDVSDIIANSIGAFVGVMLGLLLTATSARRRRDRKRIADAQAPSRGNAHA